MILGRGEAIGHFNSMVAIPNGKGEKKFTPTSIPDIEKTSIGAITDYAQRDPAELADYGDSAGIRIVQDSSGEYWGIAYTDGSHRVAAAKLRGAATVPISELEIASDEDMPRIPFAVRDMTGSVELAA